MRGNISVTADQGITELQQTTDGSNTVGITMVPTQDISQYTSDLQSRGFVIDSISETSEEGRAEPEMSRL